ncbi:MAG: hypothetical protein SNJ69_07475, partial [Chloroflexaceae bacterium]
MQRRLFPFSAAEQQRQPGSQDVSDAAPAAPLSWRATLLAMLGIVVIAALLIWFGQPGERIEGDRSATACPGSSANPRSHKCRRPERRRGRD